MRPLAASTRVGRIGRVHRVLAFVSEAEEKENRSECLVCSHGVIECTAKSYGVCVHVCFVVMRRMCHGMALYVTGRRACVH